MKNILVVNVNWLGDVIFSSPVFKALKESYPNAKISCLGVPRVKEVLECVPYVDEVIVYDEKGQHRNPFGFYQLVGQLRKQKFDAIFLLHRSFTRALLVFLAGIPKRIGYDQKRRGFLLTHKVKPLVGNVHRSDHYLNVIEDFGVQVKDRTTTLSISETSEKEIQEVLCSKGVSQQDKIIVINPGGNWDLKQWSFKNFTKLIECLMKDFPLKVVISGASKDKNLVDKIIELLTVKPIVVTGETSLKQVMALMKRASVVISADSGPLHIANSVGTDVIGIFGPTRPEITGPRGSGKHIILQHDLSCNQHACYHLQCQNNICMQAVTVQEVCDAIRQIQN